MIEVILASSNQHKAQEFGILFDPQLIKVKAAPAKLDVEETGESFEENAFIKAESYYKKFQVPVLADDSGLTVHAIPNELGLYSARFGGPGLNDQQRAELLLKKMEGVIDEQRTAYFTCVLCFYLSPKEIYFFEGRMHGKIATKYTGSAGFGYDPVFIPEKLGTEQSVAEVPEWKEQFCHRALACAEAKKFFLQRR